MSPRLQSTPGSTATEPSRGTTSPPLLPPNSVNITIEPVTSESDVPTLARLADIALTPDSFHAFRERYGSQSVYDNCVEKLTRSLRDGRGGHFIFKAVLETGSRSDEGSSGETPGTIVGFSQWSLGYVETPKVDPFASDRRRVKSPGFEAGVANATVGEAGEQGEAAGIKTRNSPSDGQSKPFYSNPDAEVARKLGSIYISTIRGKKHLCESSLYANFLSPAHFLSALLIHWSKQTQYSFNNLRPSTSDCSSLLPASRNRAKTSRLGCRRCRQTKPRLLVVFSSGGLQVV